MAVDVVRRPAPAASLPLGRIATLPVRSVLAAVVGASFALRTLAALAHAMPLYFPDEYIYSTLARSLATTGRPLVRGGGVHFPALLEPLLAAPFWLLHDPELAYRLTQAEHALFMSLAAVPAYLLGRRLQLGPGLSLAGAVLAVTIPDVHYASLVVADPVAYPLVLTALYAGVCVLTRPTRANQLAFLAAAGLATFARVQYVVLPVVLLAAALGVENGRVRAVAGRLRLTLAVLGAALAAVLTLGPSRLLGYYAGVADQRHAPGALAHWAGADLLLLAYAAGIVLVPGALVGLACALVRPRAREEKAFAALAVALAALLLLEAALYAVGSERFQERYLMALLPLAAPAFGLYVKRGLPGRGAVALVAAALVALSAAVPLSRFTAGLGKQDSPFLFAVARLEQLLGIGTGALVVAGAAAVLAALAAVLPFRPRLVPVALAATLAVSAAVAAGAFSFDRRNADAVRGLFLPADPSFVDHARLGPVDLLETAGAPDDRTLAHLFWNRSLERVLLLDGADPPDVFRTGAVRTASDGRLLLDGKPLRRPLLVNAYGVRLELAGAERVGGDETFELWRPQGAPRVRLLSAGHYFDDWLAPAGRTVVYPDAGGRVEGSFEVALHLPEATRRTVLRFTAPGLDRRVAIEPGQTRVLRLDVSARGPWTLAFRSDVEGYLEDGRAVSVRASSPTFRRAAARPAPDRPAF